MRSNRIENSIRFGAWWTETFGRFGRVFRFNFRSRARSSSESSNNRYSAQRRSVVLINIRQWTWWESATPSELVYFDRTLSCRLFCKKHANAQIERHTDTRTYTRTCTRTHMYTHAHAPERRKKNAAGVCVCVLLDSHDDPAKS